MTYTSIYDDGYTDGYNGWRYNNPYDFSLELDEWLEYDRGYTAGESASNAEYKYK